MVIKKFAKDDFDINNLIELCKESINYCCQEHYSQEQVDYWREYVVQEIFEDIYNNPDNYLGFVATEENDIAGICFLDLKKHKIKGLYVKPKYLNQKIGKNLMQQIEKEAEEKGIVELELDASMNAVEFYKSIGYLSVCKTSCSCPSCTVPEVPSINMKKQL